MEEETLNEAWAWLEEDFRLDVDSPLAISRSLWDNFTSSEDVVRSLFPAPHAEYSVSPSFSLENTESSEQSTSWDVVPDCSPSPLKRRCILKLHGSDDLEYSTSSKSGSVQSDNEQFVGTPENMQAEGPSSSNSMWYIAAEESHVSVHDVVHQSAENWMVGCLSDSDTSDVVEIPPPCPVVDVCGNTAGSKISMPRPSALKSRRSPKAAPLKVASPLSHPIPAKGAPNKMPMKRHAHGKTTQNILVTESTKPVLAYPFALVKPSGIQGDVTLQDINQRIKMAPAKANAGMKASWKKSASPLSGKSVLALTKIQTEGKGTITILRTRS